MPSKAIRTRTSATSDPSSLARQRANTFRHERALASGHSLRSKRDREREIDYRASVTRKMRLLIGEIIWKGHDLLSGASGLKRNLLPVSCITIRQR